MTTLSEQIQRMKALSGLSEAVAKPHYKDRVYDRLSSQFSTFTQEKEEIRNTVFDNLKELEKINFPGQYNVGILLFKGPKDYVYHKAVTGKIEHSEGAFVWAVLRANDLETLVFGGPGYTPKNTQFTFTIKKLMEYISVNNGNYNLTEKDLRKLTAKPEQQPATQSKEELNVINFNGSKWVVDVKNGILYQKNNPAKRKDLYAALDQMDPATADQVLALAA